MRTDRRYSRYERKQRAKRRKILMVLLVVFVLLFSVFLTVGFVKNCGEDRGGEDAAFESTAATSTSVNTEPVTLNSAAIEETTDATEPVTEATEVLTYPEELEAFLSQNGSSMEALESAGCSQLVVVDSYGTSAEIRYFSKEGAAWQEDESLFCYGYVGTQGTVYEMSEQISGTPKGLYPIYEAFYIYQKPETGLDTFEVTSDTYWVDDPDSAYYNQRVEGTANKDWNSAEHMIDYTYNYNYGFVVGYNMPPEYNKGSAIFFHIGDSPTAGCIATSEGMVLEYLKNLDASNNPYILVI